MHKMPNIIYCAQQAATLFSSLSSLHALCDFTSRFTKTLTSVQSFRNFTATMSIPMEIFEDILSRLPVKSLLRFRCVSPPWRDLIDSADFVKLHLARTIEADSHLNVVLCSDPRPHAAKLEPASLTLETTELHHHPLRDEVESEIKVWGSCNGLLCLSNEFNTIALWNPSTREYLKLPSFEFQMRTKGFEDMAIYQGRDKYGFGYDKTSDDYKVLSIMDVLDKRTGRVVEYLTKIYSVKSNSWRTVQKFEFSKLPYIEREPGVLASGALHWVMRLEIKMVGIIVAFDLGKEEWDTVPIPFLEDTDCHLFLECYRDSLCLVSHYVLGYFKIWVMKEYGVEESWTQLFSICYQRTRPVYFPKGIGEVLMQHAGGLIWFDAVNSKPWYLTVHDTVHEHRKNIEIRGVNKFMRVQVYHETLVRLGGFRKMKDEKKQKDQRKSEMAGFLSKGFKLKL